MDNTSSIPVIHYNTSNFHYKIKKDDTVSKMDTILKEKWNHLEENGILMYKLNIKEWKILEGSYGFVAQLNNQRPFARRVPEDISCMSQPLFEERFNFTKVPAKEVIFDIGDGSGNDVIVANVSPVEWGHFLYVPERFKCLPQIMKEASLRTALELLLLSSSPYLRVIFNSLCGDASVNHLHFHLYYLKHQMLLEHIELHELEGPVFELKNFPAKAFCLKLSWFRNRDIQKLCSWAFFVINHLQENNVAHNVMITRARTDITEEMHDDIRIFIWARKGKTGADNTRKCLLGTRALAGHLSVPNDIYENLSEEEVVQFMKDRTEETFTLIKQSVKKAIVDKMTK